MRSSSLVLILDANLGKLLKRQLYAMYKLLIDEYFIHSFIQYQSDLKIGTNVCILTYFIVTSIAAQSARRTKI